MNVVVAPAELPFAPRPYAAELLSSWLLRVAAANLVSLRELLDGFEERYGRVLSNIPIDYAVPEAAISALAQFCRIAPEKVRPLDLRQRAPHLSPVLLLRYPQDVPPCWCPRCGLRRVRYAFCPLCLASQRVIYVRWDWSVACLIRCGVHRTTLLDGCPACGEPDPLTFSGFDSFSAPVCRSCGGQLTADPHNAVDTQRKCDIQAVKDAYRVMLLGTAPDPALLGKATDRDFRQFVEDMLQLLGRSLNPGSHWPTASAVRFSRRDILRIISALIENAAPSTDQCIRCRRYSRGLALWAALLGIISELEGDALERLSRRWPASLRRRFLSARYHHIKKRWPYSPYGPSCGHRIQLGKIARIFGLHSSLPVPIQTVATSPRRL
jgi:hypothetical protein